MFEIKAKIKGKLGRAGVIHTPHGDINTPAFIPVATKATVKALTPEQLNALGAQVVLANTYHLYLQPGDDLVAKAGGFAKFMNWKGPTVTDSGGFQVFSLSNALGKRKNKFSVEPEAEADTDVPKEEKTNLAIIDEDGVEFKSVIDGSTHRFTPEKSVEIQHNLGADIFFAFDECASPTAPASYQREAMDRTHRWAERSLAKHRALGAGASGTPQAIFGIVQGGRHEELRKESARIIGAMDFDGFGIGGTFEKGDMGTAVRWVNEILPENKPRHLLGIGEPEDIRIAIENGCDTFDCVAPTRAGRNGTLYTSKGKINIFNAQYKTDFGKIDSECGCYACTNFTPAYLAHLFRAKEMLAGTLASIHNLYYLVSLTEKYRKEIIAGTFS